MTSIVIHEFGGMVPRSGDEFLPNEAASDAENCILLSGELRPLHAPTLLNNFYPPLSHQENTDRFGPNLDDPWETYNTYLNQVFDEEGLDPYVWIEGPFGMVNNARATGTVNWVDHNPQLQADFGDPQPTAETNNRLIDFNSLPPSAFFLTEAEDPGAWFLESGGSDATQTRDGELVNTDYEQYNKTSFNTIWSKSGTRYQDSFSVDWPVRWRLGATNLYATSTDPTVPPENLPDGNVFFNIRSPDAIGGNKYVANEPITGRGTSVSVPDQSGLVLPGGTEVFFRVEAQLQYDFDSLGDGPPDTTADIDHEGAMYTPFGGTFALEPWSLFVEEATIALTFRYNNEFEEYRTHPEGPVFLSRKQILLCIHGAVELYIEGGTLFFDNGDSGTGARVYNLGPLTPGQEYNFAATITDENGPTFGFGNRFYINGVKVREELDDPRWRTNFGQGPLYIGRIGGLTTQQYATLCYIGQVIIYETPLSDTQILNMHNATQGILPP